MGDNSKTALPGLSPDGLSSSQVPTESPLARGVCAPIWPRAGCCQQLLWSRSLQSHLGEMKAEAVKITARNVLGCLYPWDKLAAR